MGSKKPIFSHLAKVQLHQTLYLNFTIPFFNIFLLFHNSQNTFFSHFIPLPHCSHRIFPFFFFFFFFHHHLRTTFFSPPPTYPLPFFFLFTLSPSLKSLIFFLSFFFPFSFFLFSSSPSLRSLIFFLSFFFFSSSPSLSLVPSSVRPPPLLCFCFRSIWGCCCCCFRYSWRGRQSGRERKKD